MIARQITQAEEARADELFAVAFEQPLDRAQAPTPREFAFAGRWAAFGEAGQMMSTFSVTDFTVNFDGGAYRMGGIGGVATLPQYRRQGGIRACFQAALPALYQNGFCFSYLYPFSTAYYRKFGYENCVQKWAVTMDLGLLRPEKADGHFRLAESGTPLAEAVRVIDQKWETCYNMMVRHRERAYDWLTQPDPAASQMFCYVYFSAAGAPRAYVVFQKQDQPDGRNLVCRNFRFLDREGYMGLTHVLKSLSADHRLAKFELPAEPAMQYLLPEWSLGAVQWRVQPAGMVRVVHVEQALRGARYFGEGSITLRILDPLIPENDRCFLVRFSGGAAERVEVTEGPPDAVLDISAFSALICGVCDFSGAAAWMPGVRVLNRDARLDQVFYRKPLMIADYF